jgi:hypothetical protein
MMLAALLPLLGTVIDKAIPDPQVAAQAKLEAMRLAQSGEMAALDADLKIALGQIEINKVEAGTDPFRGGWLPAAGWVCVFGLGYTFLLRPLLPWLVSLTGADVAELPPIDTMELMALLGGLLGLGGFRTYERVRGKA